MTYYINEEQVNRNEFREKLLESIEFTCKESFDEFLDEVNEPIEIMGIKYDASYVFYQVDPIAYDIEMNEYFSNVFEDEIYKLDNGYEITRYNKTFRKDV